MTDKYVATTGHDDTGDGTIGNPWQTISKGVTSISAGDTLYFRAGSYTAGSNFINCVSGTSGARVTIKAYPGEAVTFTGGDASTPTVYCNANRHYITIDGIKIDGGDAANNCIKIHNGNHNWIVQNCELTRSVRSLCLTADKASGGGSNSVINCVIHDGGTSAGFDHGVYSECDNEVIDGCTIYNIPHGYGIQIYQDSASNSIIRNCLIHNCSSGGIIVGTGVGHLVYNCIIYDDGIQVLYSGSGTVANCTVVGPGTSGFAIQVDSPSDTTIVENCIVTGYTVGIGLTASTIPVTVRNNLAYGSGSNNIRDYTGGQMSQSNNLAGDSYNARFVNAAARDYRIQSDSDAIDAGITVGTFSSDYAGNTRPAGAGWDIGAYEFVEPYLIRLAYSLG